MFRKYFGVLLILLLIASVQAQDISELEYDCDVVSDVLSTFEDGDADAIAELGAVAIAENEDGDEVSLTDYIGMVVISMLAEDPEAELTVLTIFEEAQAACGTDIADTETSSETEAKGDTFNVVVNGNVNLRSCGDTSCDVVGQGVDGSLMTVVGEDGDWYEVEFEGGTAFIASWLTTRGPDEVISVDETWRDEELGCLILFDVARGDMDMNIIIAGGRRNDIFVDLYRPNESSPLNVEGQLDKTFIDTGDPYIHQYYHWGLFWPLGIYQLEVSIDNQVRMLAWELEERGDYNIFVVCNE